VKLLALAKEQSQKRCSWWNYEFHQ